MVSEQKAFQFRKRSVPVSQEVSLVSKSNIPSRPVLLDVTKPIKKRDVETSSAYTQNIPSNQQNLQSDSRFLIKDLKPSRRGMKLNEVIKSVDYFKNRALSTNSDTNKIKISQAQQQSTYFPKFTLERESDNTKALKLRSERKYELPQIAETKYTSQMMLEESGKAFEKLMNFSKNIDTQF